LLCIAGKLHLRVPFSAPSKVSSAHVEAPLSSSGGLSRKLYTEAVVTELEKSLSGVSSVSDRKEILTKAFNDSSK
jgi:hypothetical protein